MKCYIAEEYTTQCHGFYFRKYLICLYDEIKNKQHKLNCFPRHRQTFRRLKAPAGFLLLHLHKILRECAGE